MRFLSSALTATIAVAFISGCSNNSGAPGVSGPLPPLASGSQLGDASQNLTQSKGRVRQTASKNLYVADENGNDVTVYTSTGHYLYTIVIDVSKPDAILFDASQNLYAANLGYNAVYVYRPGQLNPSAGFLASCPNALAISPGGYLYVADSCDNTVSIFSIANPSQSEPPLTKNIQNPQALAFDSNGVLYVANGGTASKPDGSVAVCTGSPPNGACNKTITSHVDNPRGLAVTQGYVFVANEVAHGNVTRYHSYTNGNGYVNTWGQGDLDDPNALTFDSLGHLCASSPGNGSVVCFITSDTTFKTITNGIGHPTSMAVGPAGFLNVANFATSQYKDGSITQYCAKASCVIPGKPNTAHIDGPVSIGFGP